MFVGKAIIEFTLYRLCLCLYYQVKFYTMCVYVEVKWSSVDKLTGCTSVCMRRLVFNQCKWKEDWRDLSGYKIHDHTLAVHREFIAVGFCGSFSIYLVQFFYGRARTCSQIRNSNKCICSTWHNLGISRRTSNNKLDGFRFLFAADEVFFVYY